MKNTQDEHKTGRDVIVAGIAAAQDRKAAEGGVPAADIEIRRRCIEIVEAAVIRSYSVVVGRMGRAGAVRIEVEGIAVAKTAEERRAEVTHTYSAMVEAAEMPSMLAEGKRRV